MKLKSLSIQIAWFGLALCSTACADINWRQSLYDIGDQYSCQRENEIPRGRGGAAIDCADPNHSDRSSYADYVKAREQVSADN